RRRPPWAPPAPRSRRRRRGGLGRSHIRGATRRRPRERGGRASPARYRHRPAAPAGLPRPPSWRPWLPVGSVRAMSIKRLGIVGSGIMGSGIAEVAAKAGVEVILRSRQQASADAMVAGLAKSLAKQVEKGRLDETAAKEIEGRVTATDDLQALADCDLVIESVVEDLAVKQDLFRQLDGIVKPEGILATNTSTLPIVELATATERPDKVVGIHFFNPAPMM